MRLFLDGKVKVVRGDWPLDHRANGVLAGTNLALLLPSSDEHGDWIMLGLATGTVVNRYRPAVPRPGHPGAEAAWGILDGDQLITIKGTAVMATDARTGTSKRVATLPEAAVAINLAPAPKSAKARRRLLPRRAVTRTREYQRSVVSRTPISVHFGPQRLSFRLVR